MKAIIIVLDTLRRDHLGCYGYSRSTSPNIDRLASEGTLFDRCYATDVPTYPSFTALLSGQIGTKTGRVSFSPTELITYKTAWMPTLLAAEGFTTASVSTLYHMNPYFAAGFQYYHNPKAGARHRTQTLEAEEINAFALPWLEAHHREDFLLFVHYWDPHVESVWGRKAPVYRYEAPPDYKQRFTKGISKKHTDPEYIISQYDANIAYADEQIGRLLDSVDRLGIADETMMVFITDHGENLGETRPQGKDLWDHYDIYETIIRIPLIIKHPDIGKGKKIDALVQNVDVPRTIMEFLGVEAPPVFDGFDLVPLMRGGPKIYAEVYSETGFATCKRAIVTEDGWKLIKSIHNGMFKDAPHTELYDLSNDPGEVTNLDSREADRVRELEYRMYRWLEEALGKKPDPLRLRAGMGVAGDPIPYYGYIYPPRHVDR
jgi:arylsulfatase